MAFDVNTLFFLTMYVEAILGLLLLLAWVQNLSNRAVAWWGAAHLLRSLSVGLYGLHGSVPDWISIDVASAVLFLSFGITWSGARISNGRAPLPLPLAAGALLWVVANQIHGAFDDPAVRNLLSGAIVASFTWAAAFELWRGRAQRLVSRWPAIGLLFAVGALFLLRPPLAFLLPGATGNSALASAWLTVLSPEFLLFSIAIAFVLLAVGKEFTELGHKTAARMDPLTSLANRRAFMQDAEMVLRRQAMRGRSAAVLIVDLDHFKSINDRFGHAVGDLVLRKFGEVSSDNLRSSDIIGRIGGEEFAILLADATADNAFFVAERIRTVFQEAGAVIDGQPIDSTISVGAALLQTPDEPLNTLLKRADQALYRAKARGRNRVEVASVEAEAPRLDPLPEAVPEPVPVKVGA